MRRVSGNQNQNLVQTLSNIATPARMREDEAWLELLHKYLYTPPTLANRARTVIRNNLPHVNFNENLKRLPLPKPLREYVIMIEF